MPTRKTPEPWDGEERRADPTAEMKGELRSVREALLAVAQGMETFVSSDEIDKRLKEERRGRARLQIILLVGIIVVMLSVFVSLVQLRDLSERAARSRSINRYSQQLTLTAVNCILHNLSLHRHANEFAHQSLAEHHGVEYNEPHELLPPSETEEEKTSCKRLAEALQQNGRP